MRNRIHPRHKIASQRGFISWAIGKWILGGIAAGGAVASFAEGRKKRKAYQSTLRKRQEQVDRLNKQSKMELAAQQRRYGLGSAGLSVRRRRRDTLG